MCVCVCVCVCVCGGGVCVRYINKFGIISIYMMVICLVSGLGLQSDPDI